MSNKKSDAGDMPIGLLMSLAQHKKAMKNFSGLNSEQQKSVIRYIEDSQTGEEAQTRIQSAVDRLDQGNAKF
jgi:uncharacterized protein YdeI (YjbR/CyaY-like superfamily)